MVCTSGSKCLYCGLCVDACDEQSLRWEQPVEEVTFDRKDIHREYSNFSREEREAMMAKEEELKKAKAAKTGATGTMEV